WFVNWDNPIGGVSVGSVEEASQSLTFDVLVPMSLGTPRDILVTDFPASLESVIALLYDHPTLGQVVVEEHLPDVDPTTYVAGLEQLVANAEGPNVRGTAQIVSVREGAPGLLTTSEDGQVSELW